MFSSAIKRKSSLPRVPFIALLGEAYNCLTFLVKCSNHFTACVWPLLDLSRFISVIVSFILQKTNLTC